MSNPKRSFAEIISQAQVMTSGLRNKATEVAKRGIDPIFTNNMELLRQDLIRLNDEQERQKAEVKMKTELIDQKLKELNAQMSEAKKVVKLAIPQSGWGEFGIDDKR